MKLPFSPPLEPMLSKRADDLPGGDGWIFEPKWDGFRTVVFRDGAEWYLQSRDEKPMGRYFPELEKPILEQLPDKCVVDGEVVIAGPRGLDFEALQQRIHPAKSRIDKLARETPTSLVLWDLLAAGDEDLRATPFAERRARLERAVAARAPIHLTPLTRDRAVAEEWFRRFEGAGLDGVMAKRADGVYEPGKRVMLKIKHERTADCVVAGFRWHKNGNQTLVGSLLLGLYDGEGMLHHVGVSASFPEKRRRELVAELAPYRLAPAEDHPWKHWADMMAHEAQRLPGAVSRWSRGKTLAFEPLRPELVVEVAYDHMQGDRFRHTAQFRRWRTDKPPAACRYDQLEVTPPYELQRIFERG